MGDMVVEGFSVTTRPRTGPIAGVCAPRFLDSRKRITVVIGDGFTQSYLANQKISDIAPCSIKHLFCPPSSVQYHPVAGDKFDRGPLLTKERWKNLYPLCVRYGNDHVKLLEILRAHAQGWAGGAHDIGMLLTSSTAVELRFYLWHYFRHIESVIAENASSTTSWEWLPILKFIVTELNAVFVSFNYDMVLHRVLQELTPLVCYPAANLLHCVQSTSVNVPIVLHPHGAIFINRAELDIFEEAANPWIMDWALVDCRANSAVFNYDFKLQSRPFYPNILPPGLDVLSHYLPHPEMMLAIKEQVRRSEIVLIIGLSGEEPDGNEVRSILYNVSKKAMVYYVTYEGPRVQTQVAKSLMGFNLRYKHLSASEVPGLLRELETLCKDGSAGGPSLIP